MLGDMFSVPLKAMNRTDAVEFDCIEGMFIVTTKYPFLKNDDCLILITDNDNPILSREMNDIRTTQIIPIGICKYWKINLLQTIYLKTKGEFLTDSELCYKILEYLVDKIDVEYAFYEDKPYDIMSIFDELDKVHFDSIYEPYLSYR